MANQQPDGSPVSANVPAAGEEESVAEFLQAYRTMLLARTVEDKLAGLYRAGRIVGGVFLGKGQEAFSVSLAMQLRHGDVYAPLIRDQAGRLAFGDNVLDTMRTYLGSSLGPMRGRDGNIHRGRPKEGYFAMISHLGAMVSAVAGALLAKRFKGISGVVGATCIGDGGTSTGSFHEGLNLAAVEKLPLVIFIANNQYAYSTPTERQYACRTLLDRAIGYGVEGYEIDGTDLEVCLDTARKAVSRAREGGGPQIVVGNLLRLVGHGEHDDASYVPDTLKHASLGRDCVALAEQRILDEGWADREALDTMRRDAVEMVEKTVRRVLREPAPEARDEEWKAISTRRLSELFEGDA